MYCVASTHTWYTDTHHTSVAAVIVITGIKPEVFFTVFGEGALNILVEALAPIHLAPKEVRIYTIETL